MTRHLIFMFGTLALFAAGCEDETTPTVDAALPDAKVSREASVDKGAGDKGAGDKGTGDKGTSDLAKVDAALADMAKADSAAPDQKVPDMTKPDAKIPDKGMADLPSGCNTTKITNLTQGNSSKHELYEFCYAANDTATQTLVKSMDSTLKCSNSSGGIAAKCPSGTWRCMGALQLNYPAKDIKTTHWKVICAISWLKSVTKIVGGYYI